MDRMSLALSPELGRAAREAAQRAGMSLSGWFSRAAADRIRTEMLGAALDTWEADHGPLTDAELAAARRSLYGVSPVR